MVLPYRVQPATISSIGRATGQVAITRTARKVVTKAVVVGCTVRIAYHLMVAVLMVETEVE